MARLAALVVAGWFVAWLGGTAAAFEPRQGCLLAERACPALQSIQKQSNPGSVTLQPGQRYELLGANKATATYFQIRIPSADPSDRWVEAACGRAMPQCEAPGGPVQDRTRASAVKPTAAPHYLLALSWEPAFCEGHRDKPECRSQADGRYDAANLVLHGLWPQPEANAYCGVGQHAMTDDGQGRWSRLPPVELAAETRQALGEVMPGTQSALERHEWLKHGTCSGQPADAYFRAAIRLVREVNASAVRNLLADNIGRQVTLARIRDAFDQSFGQGAGRRVAMVCTSQGGRRLVAELRINLTGDIGNDARLADLLAAAPPAGRMCEAGEVDPVGFADSG